MKYIYYFVILAVNNDCLARIFFVNNGQSIQAAADSASNGDSIAIADGIYQETILVQSKSLLFGSYWIIDRDTCHLSNTIIEPGMNWVDTSSCFVLANLDSGAVRIVGLTLRGGLGSRWHYRNAEFPRAGGAILAMECDLDIDRCNIIDCRAGIGGGILCGSMQANYVKSYRATNNNFVRCSSESGDGGAIYSIQVRAFVAQATFMRNSAVGVGGAINCLYASLVIDSCRIDCTYSGSGAVTVSEAQLRLNSTDFANNNCAGGGTCDLIASSSTIRVEGCNFRNNISPTHSINFIECDGLGIAFERNQVRFCTSTLHTGTILCSECNLIFSHNLFADNFTGGGGLFAIIGNPSYIRIRHNVITGNRARQPVYGSVLFDQTYQRSIMDSNYITGNGSPVVSGVGQNHIPFYCLNNWWGHESGPYHAELNPTGQGDTLVGDDCEFIPWLTAPPDTTGWLPAIERPRSPISRTWELVNVFPNPFNSSVMILFSGTTGADFEISIHNLLGQKVDTITHGALTGTVINYTAPRELSSGVYFLVARDRVNIETKKVVLLR